MSDFFNSSNEEEFRDIPDEVAEDGVSDPVNVPNVSPVQVIGPQPTPEEQAQNQYIDSRLSEVLGDEAPVYGDGQDYEDSELTEEESYESILDDARLRLEQGRLYEMVMKHNPFEGLQADPKAVKIVQNQIVKFAKEQMEIMLGMRQPAQQQQIIEQQIIESPFNDLEVKVLQEFASKMTGGRSSSPEANMVAHKLKTIADPAPQQELRTIAQIQPPAPQSRQAPRPQQPQPRQQARPLPSKPKTPIKRERLERLAEEFGVNPKDIGYKPLKKPLHKMTEQELIARNKEAAARQAGSRSAPAKAAKPMPSFEQQKMMYEQNISSASNGTVSFILGLIDKQPKTKK